MKAKTPVLFCDNPVEVISDDMILKLSKMAGQSLYRRSRICLHPREESRIQQMLICLQKGTYIRPHRQPARYKSYLIFKGRAVLILFSNDGVRKRKITLDAKKAGASFCRFPSDQFHTIAPLTDEMLYVETVEGVFNPDDTEYAPWAPGETDTEKDSYMNAIME